MTSRSLWVGWVLPLLTIGIAVMPARLAIADLGVGEDGIPVAPFFGNGVKVGEVAATSAIIWTRLSEVDECGDDFAMPGSAGDVRVRFAQDGDWRTTQWAPVDPAADHTIKVRLSDLLPNRRYTFVVEARRGDATREIKGSFRTAAAPDDPAHVAFVVTTGHKYKTIDDPGRGQKIYPAMAALDPHFFVHTGDVVYYDHDTPPNATDVALARMHWHRMYALPNQRSFHAKVPSYFIKDDHDLLKNDCWPGQRYKQLTFEEGQSLFREQSPLGDGPAYRTYRWGRDLQVWVMEGRDYRSPNKMEDGPDKTIWGDRQKAWLRDTFEASDATFKVLISPTPIVGPDRAKGKNDNHANAAFQTEGAEVREFLAKQPNTIVVCGDRHWQYASVDPETGLREYCSGPSTKKHSGGWNQKNRLPEHRFLRVNGGFLMVSVDRWDNEAERRGDVAFLRIKHFDVDGKVVFSDDLRAE